jgi:CheY-like chemotaxis protein
MAQIETTAGSSSESIATIGWLIAGDTEHATKADSISLQHLGGDHRRRVVLLAEDNLLDALVIEDAILRYELPVDLHVVDDGQKACKFIDRAESDPEAPRPEFLLLDLNLPKRSGLEVLKHLRESTRFGDIPVIIVTSSDLSRDLKEFEALGANRYFRKPSSYEEFMKLGGVLKELLDQY